MHVSSSHQSTIISPEQVKNNYRKVVNKYLIIFMYRNFEKLVSIVAHLVILNVEG